MRISHDLAIEIANVLTQKSKVANEKLRTDIDALVFETYTKAIPKELVKLDKAIPDWVHKSGSIYVRYRVGNLQRTHITVLKGKVITKGGNPDIKATTVIRNKIIQLSKQEEALRALKKDTIRAVLALGTSKRVLQQFPGAEAALKARGNLPVVPVNINVHDLKAKLQKQ
jgi:hypothetical protein